ncbi:MAG: SMP-30/gluconolactonase/LRE family protein [Nitrospira sp.]|nr:SMP-30/gluconolactonase/LRE family protein [Nitrospira sp.]
MSVCRVEEVQSSSLCQSPGFPQWTFDQSHIFPQDRPLARPEDGKALPDGRLVVADERYGLVLIEGDDFHRPFGRFVEAGYVHTPPDPAGGVQAVFLEHDTRHLLVGDIYTGKIYRVDTQTEETRLIYDHPYGVNSVYRDRKGTIWFTQSTNNTDDRGKDDLWASVNLPVPTGAVFKLSESGDKSSEKAEEVVSNLYFANGITFDKTEKYMYVSESMMDRVLRFRVDVENGLVSEREVYQNVYVPDNLAIDRDNNLWIASFAGNKVIVVDNTCRAVHTVFQATSTSHSAFLDEWTKRSHLGQPRNAVLTPKSFDPLPNFLTGLFFSHNFDTVYFTGLGNAILSYAMPTGR